MILNGAQCIMHAWFACLSHPIRRLYALDLVFSASPSLSLLCEQEPDTYSLCCCQCQAFADDQPLKIPGRSRCSSTRGQAVWCTHARQARLMAVQVLVCVWGPPHPGVVRGDGREGNGRVQTLCGLFNRRVYSDTVSIWCRCCSCQYKQPIHMIARPT